MGKGNSENTGKKKKPISLSKLINQAVKDHGEKTVLSAVERKCGKFNDIATLKEYIDNGLQQETPAVKGWLRNSLEKLGKERRPKRDYSGFSQAPKEAPTGELLEPEAIPDGYIDKDEPEEAFRL